MSFQDNYGSPWSLMGGSMPQAATPTAAPTTTSALLDKARTYVGSLLPSSQQQTMGIAPTAAAAPAPQATPAPVVAPTTTTPMQTAMGSTKPAASITSPLSVNPTAATTAAPVAATAPVATTPTAPSASFNTSPASSNFGANGGSAMSNGTPAASNNSGLTSTFLQALRNAQTTPSTTSAGTNQSTGIIPKAINDISSIAKLFGGGSSGVGGTGGFTGGLAGLW